MSRRRNPASRFVALRCEARSGEERYVRACESNSLFEYLDAPVKRVAALDCPVAYAPVLEEAILPGSADVLKAIRTLAKY